jgi:hypothetical protein
MTACGERLASMVEGGCGGYARRIAADDDPVMSAVNLVETSIVRGLKKIAPDQAQAVRSAHLQFGKKPVTRP